MKFRNYFSAFLAVSSALVCSAQVSLDAINQEAKRDLDSAIKRLGETRDTIRQERIPLSRSINQLKTEVREKRRELERQQRAQDSRSIGLDALEQRIKAIQDENDYVAGMMNQFLQELQTQMTSGEQQKYEDRIDGIREVLDTPDSPRTESYAVQVDAIRIGIERLEDRIGGTIIEGQAIDSQGDLQAGHFIEFGPASVFYSDATKQAGIIESHQVLTPNATALNGNLDTGAAKIVAEGKADLPIDVTLGAALAIETSKESIPEHIGKGGIWVYPILFFATLAMLLAAYKLFEIFTIKQPQASQLSPIIHKIRQNDKEEAERMAEQLPWEFGPMIKDGVKYSDQDKALVEEVMYEKMLEAQPKVERFLSVIAVTAAVAPLLGLLGTVTGMINTFKMITLFGTGDASSLSGGISEALITTELGLVVAIPSLVAHAMLNRKAQSIMAHMEKLSVIFVNGLPTEAKNEQYAS